jgi:hypothetical protein
VLRRIENERDEEDRGKRGDGWKAAKRLKKEGVSEKG